MVISREGCKLPKLWKMPFMHNREVGAVHTATISKEVLKTNG